MTVRHSWLTMAALIALKAASCFGVQSRKACSISFEVSGVRIDVCSASFGRYTAIYRMSPRKDQTSDAIFGVGQDKILSMHDDVALIPRCDMWWPRKSTSVRKNFDFLALRQRLCSHRHFIISCVCSMCSCMDWDQMMISSIYM
jgi:hypothetical protein